MSFYEKQRRKRFSIGLNNNALVFLIAINLVVFVLFTFVKVFYMFTFVSDVAQTYFYRDIYANLALPAGFGAFAGKPWTVLTHMFYHDAIWHIIGNMIWLWMFGYIFLDLTGNKKIIPLYFFGALGGAIAFMLAYNFIPTLKEINASATGASAGIMAVVVATTMIAPDFRIFPMLNGGIPLWVITLIYLIIDLALIANFNNTGGHIAHLAGAFTGFLFIYFLRRGYDWSTPINNFFEWVNNLFNPARPVKKTKQQSFYKQGRNPYTKTPNLTQQRIDEILDKISQKGYQSLSEEEKELLKKASKEDL